MAAYAALLRAVNVGGTGKLPMSVLAAACADAGARDVRTHLASGNAVFHSDDGEAEIRPALELRLGAYAARPIGVLVRSAAELAGVVARNPFREAPGGRVAALFTDEPLPAHPLEGARGHADEDVRLGLRELYVHYPQGMGVSRLRLPAAGLGTARNMNTVAALARLIAER